MAYLPQDEYTRKDQAQQDEERLKLTAGTGQGVVQSTGTGLQTGQSPQERAPTRSGTFTNFQRYIEKLAPQSLESARSLASQVGQEQTSKVQTALTGAQRQFEEAARAGTISSDRGMTERAIANPYDFLLSEEAPQFQSLRQSQYGGPMSLEETGGQQSVEQQIKTAQDQLNKLLTTQGRSELLGSRSGMTPGQRALDVYLLGSTPGAERIYREQATQTLTPLQEQLTAATELAKERARRGQTASQEYIANINKQLQQARGGYETQLTQEQQDRLATLNALRESGMFGGLRPELELPRDRVFATQAPPLAPTQSDWERMFNPQPADRYNIRQYMAPTYGQEIARNLTSSIISGGPWKAGQRALQQMVSTKPQVSEWALPEGYAPSDEELNLLGINREQYNLMNEQARQLAQAQELVPVTAEGLLQDLTNVEGQRVWDVWQGTPENLADIYNNAVYQMARSGDLKTPENPSGTVTPEELYNYIVANPQVSGRTVDTSPYMRDVSAEEMAVTEDQLRRMQALNELAGTTGREFSTEMAPVFDYEAYLQELGKQRAEQMSVLDEQELARLQALETLIGSRPTMEIDPGAANTFLGDIERRNLGWAF